MVSPVITQYVICINTTAPLIAAISSGALYCQPKKSVMMKMAESLELRFRVESAAVAVLLAAMLVQTSLVAVLLPILVRRTDYQNA